MGEKVCGSYRAKLQANSSRTQTSKYIAGCFYADTSGVFQSKTNASAEGPEKTVTTLQSVVTAGTKSQWLVLVRPQGVMEVNSTPVLWSSQEPYSFLITVNSQIWTLPKLTLIFSTTAVSMLDSVLVDSGDAPALSLPQDPPRKPQELDIEQILITPLGESSPKPHLLVSVSTL